MKKWKAEEQLTFYDLIEKVRFTAKWSFVIKEMAVMNIWIIYKH